MKEQNQRLRAPAFAIKFNDSLPSAQIQILRVGEFDHPFFGKFDITAKTLQSMVANWSDEARRVDLAIDYAHEADQKAAGWVTQLYLLNDETELWADVEWTPAAEKVLLEKEFRYISADFTENFVDPESKQEFGPTLFGAALTNRPFVKGMAPVVQLTEAKDEEKKQGGTCMEKQLQELQDKQVKLSEENVLLKSRIAKFDDIGEADAVKKELDDLKAEVAELKAEKVKVQEEKELAEKNAKFDSLMKDGKTVEAQRESYLSGDTAKFAELSGEVNLGEKGSSNEGDTKLVLSAEDEVIKLAEKVMEEKKVSIDTAIQIVLEENPKLNEKYEKGV